MCVHAWVRVFVCVNVNTRCGLPEHVPLACRQRQGWHGRDIATDASITPLPQNMKNMGISCTYPHNICPHRLSKAPSPRSRTYARTHVHTHAHTHAHTHTHTFTHTCTLPHTQACTEAQSAMRPTWRARWCSTPSATCSSASAGANFAAALYRRTCGRVGARTRACTAVCVCCHREGAPGA